MPDFDLDAALSPQSAFEGEPQREYQTSLGPLVGGRAGRYGAAHYTLKPIQPLPPGYVAKVERYTPDKWILRVFHLGAPYFVDEASTLEGCLRRFGIWMQHGDW